MTSDPKPGKRVKATRKEWAGIRAEKLDMCRVCGTKRGLTGHHVVGRDLGGDDVADNIVPLCWACHPLVEERNQRACRILGGSLTDRELDYAFARKGADFMKRYYGVPFDAWFTDMDAA